MSQSSSAWSVYCNGAVYLNNVGCALLEQGAYDDAMDTFRDAVAIIKTVCVAADSSQSSNSQSKTIQDINSSLRLPDCIVSANQRLAFPNRCQVVSQELPLCFDAPTPAMGFLALEDYRYFEFDTHLFHHPHHTLVCPIRMEDSSTADSDLVSGIMLYNLALSYTCVAKCQTIVANRNQLNQAAARLFELADAILQRCISTVSSADSSMSDCSDDDNDDDIDDGQLMHQYLAFINIAVLHGLLQLMVSTTDLLQQENAFEQVLDRLCILHHTAFNVSETEDLFSTEYLPAPAA